MLAEIVPIAGACLRFSIHIWGSLEFEVDVKITSSSRSAKSFAAVLIILLITLSVGLAIRWPCSESIGREAFTRLCYTDVISLYEHKLAQGRFPYVETWIEYPVLTGLYMWLTGVAVASTRAFFLLTVIGLSTAAVITTLMLYRMVGPRALFFAAAPSLAVLAFINWDLLAVAFATGAVLALLKQRPGWAGVLLGLGTAAKGYPAILLVPFAAHVRRRHDTTALVRLVAGAVGAWLAPNAYFMITAFQGWGYFYRVSADRGIDAFTISSFVCRVLAGTRTCGTEHPLVGAASLLALVSLSALVWWSKRRRDPDTEWWTLGFPVLIVLLLTSKIYSPQYSLWLLPWFGLVLPDVRLFLLFELTDVAVFVATFSSLGAAFGFGGVPEWFVLVAVVARAAILAACVLTYVVRSSPRLDRTRLVLSAGKLRKEETIDEGVEYTKSSRNLRTRGSGRTQD